MTNNAKLEVIQALWPTVTVVLCLYLLVNIAHNIVRVCAELAAARATSISREQHIFQEHLWSSTVTADYID